MMKRYIKPFDISEPVDVTIWCPIPNEFDLATSQPEWTGRITYRSKRKTIPIWKNMQ